MFRYFSLFFRRRGERRDLRSVLSTRKLWEQELASLPEPVVQEKTLLLIRLDDIGDYLVYRNFLPDYRLGKWAGYKVTFVGNVVWKPIFEQYDAAAADQAIWVDKKRYFGDEAYRRTLWWQLRSAGFSAAICPSRSRPLLLDDMLVLASGAPFKEAVANTFHVPEWNMISDNSYDRLFPSASDLHEFVFNRQFSEWVNQLENKLQLPELPVVAAASGDEIICFIGASAKSRRWPLVYWIRLVKALQQQGMLPVIGGGKNDEAMAAQITAATGAASFAGQLSLPQSLKRIAEARAVISGDTMAAHAAVAGRTAVVIISNGVNAPRFVTYESLPGTSVRAVYTSYYQRFLARGSRKLFRAVSRDMYSIRPEQVLTALLQLL